MPHATAVVLASDHSCPPGLSPKLYEFHPVVRIEETGEVVRLRSDRGSPLRLLHLRFSSVASLNEADVEKLAEIWDEIHAVAEMFQPGSRLSFFYGIIPACRRSPELGYDPMDVALDPATLQRLGGQAPRLLTLVVDNEPVRSTA